MTLKGILIFSAGVATGALAAWYVLSKRKKEAVEEKIEEKRQEYFKEEETVAEPGQVGQLTPDYTQFYGDSHPKEDPAEKEHPKEEETTNGTKKPPKLIKEEEYGSLGFSEVTLFYYTDDDVLAIGDETEEKEVDEVKDWIGDALDKFDFRTNNDKVLCVRNYDRKCDYRIEKCWGAFAPEDY